MNRAEREGLRALRTGPGIYGAGVACGLVLGLALCTPPAPAAGTPVKTPPPERVRTADLAGHYFAITFNGAKGGINFYDNGTYQHWLWEEDKPWAFAGRWYVRPDGLLVLHETADGGRTWCYWNCRPRPNFNTWYVDRTCFGSIRFSIEQPPAELTWRYEAQGYHFTLSRPAPFHKAPLPRAAPRPRTP